MSIFARSTYIYCPIFVGDVYNLVLGRSTFESLVSKLQAFTKKFCKADQIKLCQMHCFFFCDFLVQGKHIPCRKTYKMQKRTCHARSLCEIEVASQTGRTNESFRHCPERSHVLCPTSNFPQGDTCVSAFRTSFWTISVAPKSRRGRTINLVFLVPAHRATPHLGILCISLADIS